MNLFTLTSDSNNSRSSSSRSSNVGNFDNLTSSNNNQLYPNYSESSASTITMGNEQGFTTSQLAFDPYYYNSNQYGSISSSFQINQNFLEFDNNQIYNQRYQVSVPSNEGFFNNDQIQYLTPPIDNQPILNHYRHQPILPEYRSNSTLKKIRRRPRLQKDTKSSAHEVKQCKNCNITETPSWRRDKTNQYLLCNACGLYEKLHNKHRPIVVDNGVVKLKRNRVSGSGNGSGNSNNKKKIYNF